MGLFIKKKIGHEQKNYQIWMCVIWLDKKNLIIEKIYQNIHISSFIPGHQIKTTCNEVANHIFLTDNLIEISKT